MNRSHTSRLPLIVAIVAGVLVVGALTFAGIIVIPQIVRAATTETAQSDTTVILAKDGVVATVPVRAGWGFTEGGHDTDHTFLTSPDGRFGVELTVVAGADPEQAARDAIGQELTAFDREPAGAATLLHARTPAEDATAGAVVVGDGAVVFVARPGAPYDAELAALLSGIEVAP